MGLDQAFLISEKQYSMEDIIIQYENGSVPEVELTDVIWLRKVPILQGYMENLAIERYGERDYNSLEIPLTIEDLNHLKTLCLLRGLDESASGFFWGTHHEDHYSEISQAIDTVLEEMGEGDYIYYYGNY